MKRYLEKYIKKDLSSKMVFIGGPRQVGKTTLSQRIAPKNSVYINWDVIKDRQFVLKERVPLEPFVIFDELHKYKEWRSYIKGIYDVHKKKKKILVTGSARLDYYRHSGDSLQGRYYYYNLHPLSVKELGIKTDSDFSNLTNLGGFPEPYLSGSKVEAKRWRQGYQSRVVQEDISSLENSSYLNKMELLGLRLPELVGSPLSINSLREDFGVAHKTMSSFLEIFERLYLIFRVSPMTSNLVRAVKKEQKHYHYDWALIDDESKRFENLVGSHLLKWVHFQQDVFGESYRLSYFRDVDGREVDFVLMKDNKPFQAIEVKLSGKNVSPHLKYLKNKFPNLDCVQVNLKISREYETKEGIKMLNWLSFLNKLI